MHSSSIVGITAKFFFIAALFPFVSFGTNTMDSQPHYIFLAIFSFVLFAASGAVFKKTLDLIILLTVILLTLLLMEDNFGFIFIRAIASYSGFFVTLAVSIIYFEKFGLPIKTIVIANIIYIFAGILQMVFGCSTLDLLVISNTYCADFRSGVTSLTPEHTFYGIVLYFLSWILLVIYDYKPPLKITLLILINIFTIFVLAKSSMVIIYLIVSVMFYILRSYKKKAILKILLISVFISFLTLYLFVMLMPEHRFSGLVNIGTILDGSLLNRIFAIIAWDASINDRMLNVVFPYYGVILNYGMPGGLDSYYKTSLILVEYFDGFFWAGLGSNKILSFTGTFIYELGFIGILAILYMYRFLKDKNNPNRFFELILLFVILNSAIAVAFALAPILMAIMYYKKIHPEAKLLN